MRRLSLIPVAAAVRALAAQSPAPATWGYGGGPQQIRYSPLAQINRSNVTKLEVAWTYDNGETGALQTQPVVVGNVLFGYTPTHKTFALNAASWVRNTAAMPSASSITVTSPVSCTDA